MLYNIRAVKGPRICQSCIESGNCKTYSNGKEIQWNGFMLFYNGDYKTTDVLLDIAGHRASFNITNVTPAEFLKGLSHDKSILDKLRAFFKSDDFWKSFITEGIRLEEVIGFEVLEKDLKFWLHDIASASRSHYAKNIKLENCLEVSF
uniref:Uncharacterized protein n=1 Tax=Meloidogyne hapla TaxID=6305 RepID=A0A1I8BXC4_MELHA